MNWRDSLYAEEWDELFCFTECNKGDPGTISTLDNLMKWMIKAVNKRIEQECNCGNNSKPYCITKEY